MTVAANGADVLLFEELAEAMENESAAEEVDQSQGD